MEEECNTKLENKIDKIMDTVTRIDKEVTSVKTTVNEREKSDVLRNEVLGQALKMQTQAHADLKDRVIKLENNQSKLVWVIISAVLVAVLGLVIKI